MKLKLREENSFSYLTLTWNAQLSWRKINMKKRSQDGEKNRTYKRNCVFYCHERIHFLMDVSLLGCKVHLLQCLYHMASERGKSENLIAFEIMPWMLLVTFRKMIMMMTISMVEEKIHMFELWQIGQIFTYRHKFTFIFFFSCGEDFPNKIMRFMET